MDKVNSYTHTWNEDYEKTPSLRLRPRVVEAATFAFFSLLLTRGKRNALEPGIPWTPEGNLTSSLELLL
ncbi:hypothetical protein NPIL_382331 [Nephila pilipes]|uniref:Uncharacterized protein n=1 Tax=Nephila pilipes TaxID=299642 RepID=A0A8X6QBZ6_NEPPI|nr:hypothetical protein NPIL_382331 [Nephila pilipes]